MLLAVLVVVVVPAAAAAAPSGFRETSRLQPIASAVSPGAIVYCSRSEDLWRTDVSERFPGAPSWSRVGAYYVGSEVFLSPFACRALEGWLRGKNVPTLQYLAVYSLTLVHELMHARGIVSERAADCAALKVLPGVLRTYLHVRNAVTLRRVVRLAWADNAAKPAEYRC